MTSKEGNLENLAFEKAMIELEEIVDKLGSGKVNLEDTVSLYQRGVLLKKHCDKKLSDAKMKVEVLLKE